MKFLKRLTLLCVAIVSLLSSGILEHAQVYAGSSLSYGFEDGTDGFTAPNWLGANAGQPFQSSAQHTEGTYSLALPVRFTNDSWDQAGVDKVINNNSPVDLTNYAAVSYDIYVPVSHVWSDLDFNNPWLPPTNPKPLRVGWNTVTFDLSPTSQDFPNAGSYFSTAREFVVRAIGRGTAYNGPIYFDNIHFILTTHPIVQTIAPQPDDILQAPPGKDYTIQTSVKPPPDETITKVTFRTQAQTGVMTFDSTKKLYTASWNLWMEGDGLKTLSIIATASNGMSTTMSVSVLVQDSWLHVHITAPTFDQQLQGRTIIRAQIQPDPRFALKQLTVQVGPLSLYMIASANVADLYMAQLDTRWLPDGVCTIKVIARDAYFTASDVADVLIENHPQTAHIIGARGNTFIEDGKPFRYVGWNEYDLFTFTDETLAHNEQTIEGNILLKGTRLTWKGQVDRQMMEAERNGLTVLRTWAFNDDVSDPNNFQSGPGQYNEAEFQKLDYILASAQRHHIRVILTMENYWNDFGGIQQYANWLGLPDKLLFFTDNHAQALYKQYIAHMVNRVNTVTGVAYKNDPTIFAWELMNEPRMDCADDPTPTHQYCDPTGQKLLSWVKTMSSYIKGLDPRHMVTTGAEGHGFIPTGPHGQGMQWGKANEGNGNSPLMTQNVPTINFFTFHPYPNASWPGFTIEQTRQLIQGITQAGRQAGKPVVMEEYGLDRLQPLHDKDGQLLQPGGTTYLATLVCWYQDILTTFYRAGGAGSNVWNLAQTSDRSFNINPYLPSADARRDAPVMAVLAQEASRVGRPQASPPYVLN